MAQAALLVIDVQHSFLHRDFWQEDDFPAFQRHISALIAGCQAKGIPVVDVRSEQCCETTARVASDLGFKVLFVSEATLTFPMTHNGITLSSAELIHRTETVLVNRFAEIVSVEACLARV
ncbi:MAG: hypothetical protein E6556_22415 [Pantoea sp.]|nr:hypothetical protein [Pantoea sp.]